MNNVEVIEKILKFEGSLGEACDIFEELGFNARQIATAVLSVEDDKKDGLKRDRRILLLRAIRNALYVQ